MVRIENQLTTWPKNFALQKVYIKRWLWRLSLHSPTHYRVLSFLLMPYSIAVHTGLAGSASGTFLDDLTNRMLSPTPISSRFHFTILAYPLIIAGVGKWPSTQAITRICKIVVYSGAIIDSVRITYELENTATPITITHGGPHGHETLSFEIGGNNSFLLLVVHSKKFIDYSRRKTCCCLWHPACESRPLGWSEVCDQDLFTFPLN